MIPRSKHAPVVDDIVRTVAAAFETYPELDVAEVLATCRVALEDIVRQAHTEGRGTRSAKYASCSHDFTNSRQSAHAGVNVTPVRERERESSHEQESSPNRRASFGATKS
jgi:hypothetical protein